MTAMRLKILILISLLCPISLFAVDYTVYPTPLDIQLTNEKFDLKGAEIVTFKGPEAAFEEIALHLSRELAARYNVPLRYRKAAEPETGFQAIILGFLSDQEVISALNEMDVKPDPRLNAAESYQLVVGSSGVIVAGSDLRGLFYGVQSLIQLIEYRGQGKDYHGQAHIKGARISDKPDKPFRGVHVYLPAREDIPFFKNFIKFLARYKLNTLIMEVGGGMRMDKHPEINIAWEHFTRSMYDMGDTYLQYDEQIPLGKDRRFQASTHPDLAGGSWLSKEEVRDIVDFARQHYLEVVPEIQGLSHAYYLALAHRDIAEPVGSTWPDSYDPSNPKTYRLLFDVMDEYLEVFQPEWVHIGHDEWRARVKSQPGNGAVFAQDVLKIYNHLKSRGIKTMMWADHLIKGHNLEGKGGDKPPEDSYVWYSYPSTEGAPEILAVEADDILMLNWSWAFVPSSISQLKDHGWKQILGNFSGHRMYEQWESVLSDQSILGAEMSTWCGANEYLYALNDHFLNMLLSQHILWSGKTPPINEVYEHLSTRMPEVRSTVSMHRLPSRDVTEGRTGYTFLTLDLPGGKNSMEQKDDSIDLTAIKPGKIKGNNFIFNIPVPENFIAGKHDSDPDGTIRVNSNAASILFLHVSSGKGEKLSLERTRYFEDKAQLIGYYRVHYKDGLAESVPIRYGQNILHLGNGYQDQIYFAQTVKLSDSGDGEPVLASIYEWVCPRPNREIESIDLIGVDSKSDIYPILLAVTIVKLPFIR
ncbi:MAG: hypothetical protein AMS26_17950 [Bacteroides sp. SM23_62]|nr:MAG: hypothetical protein AMS26_17950 [Bacteroides sp. SM23_62]